MALSRINGRTHYFDCGRLELAKCGNGRWTVSSDRRVFEIIGGTESGGAADEWFCNCPILYGERWVSARSMVEAIKLGING